VSHLAEKIFGGVVPRQWPAAGSRPTRHTTVSRVTVLAILLLNTCALTLLGGASWLGQYVRPSGDEWCFLPKVRDEGLGAIVDWFYNSANGRVVNGVLVESYTAPGVIGHRVYPAVSAALTVVVLWALASRIRRVLGWQAPRGLTLLVATTATVLFLFGSQNTYQTFFWPGAAVSHTFPPVLACAVLWAALSARTRTQRSVAQAVVAVAGAAIALVSEETALVCCGVLCTVVVLRRRLLAAHIRSYVTRWSLCGLAGVALGAAILVTAPGMQKRRVRFDAGASMASPESLWLSLQDWLIILVRTLMSWQYSAAVAVGFLAGLLMTQERRATALSPARPALVVPLCATVFLLCGYACTVMVRPAFGVWASHSVRIRNDYLLLFIALLIACGVLFGRAIRARLTAAGGKRTGAALAGAFLVCGVGSAGLVPPLAGFSADMRVRAEQWDRQSAWMHQRAAKGARTLPYKPLPIAGLREPFQLPKGEDWAASCAARYYRVDTVTPSSVLP
jgi:uncharacterized protein DUF6056